MPLDTTRFKPSGIPGCKWDRRSREALFDVVTGSGKNRERVRRIFAFESVEAAKHAFPDFRTKVKAGEFSDAPKAPEPIPDVPDGITLAEYVPAHWDSLHVRCAVTTRASNDRSYRSHLLPFFGTTAVVSIDEAACEDFVAYMLTKEAAPPTINFALRLLRKILHHARRRNVRGAVPENFHFVKEALLKLELDDTEQDRFFAAFDDEQGFRDYLRKEHKREGKVIKSARFGFKERAFGGGLKPDSDAAGIYFKRFQRSKLLFIAAVDLGYRGPSDLRLLKRTAVDLKRGLASVITEKTGKPANVAMSDRCREAVVASMSGPLASAEYVFVTEEGKPYSDSTIRRYYAIAKQLAGITRRCRLNDLRHTFASNLASEGCSLLDIRDALGHTSARMSERYAKPNADSIERVRAALNAHNNRQRPVRSDTLSDTQAANE